MKKVLIGFTVLGAILAIAAPLLAANTANQTVTFQVLAINELAVSGNPAALTINAATAGSEPTSVTDATTTYAFTTNQQTRKITGAINANMPANTTLAVGLAAATAPNAWTSTGSQTLSTSAADLATGGRKRANALTITYQLSATVDAGEVASDTRAVTLTLTSQ